LSSSETSAAIARGCRIAWAAESSILPPGWLCPRIGWWLASRQQKHIAAQAEIIMRGLATVGIIALVDEATGYQDPATTVKRPRYFGNLTDDVVYKRPGTRRA